MYWWAVDVRIGILITIFVFIWQNKEQYGRVQWKKMELHWTLQHEKFKGKSFFIALAIPLMYQTLKNDNLQIKRRSTIKINHFFITLKIELTSGFPRISNEENQG